MSRPRGAFRTELAIALAGVAFAASALAAPAPWYLWRSKLDGQWFCAQTRPGAGWDKSRGPFKDARCEKPGEPGQS